VVRGAKSTRYNAKPRKTSTSAAVTLIGKGVVVGLVVSLIAVVLLTLANVATDSVFLEEYNRYIMVAITVGSIFLGSAYAAKKAGAQGIIIGMSVGLIYVLVSVAIGLEMSDDSPLLMVLTSRVIAGVAAGALGGLVGVNL